MTKQNVVPAEAVAAITAAAAVASSSPLYPYPPPRSFQKKYLSQLDFAGGRIGTWVESMKASSPTHTKAVGAIGAPVDEQSAAWIMRYPSALTKFEQIMSASKGKQIVMFLDYDGTLSPIVEDPDSAFMTDAVNPSLFSYLLFHCSLLKDDISIVSLLLWRRQMRAAVRNVARYFPTAIVTGRCLEKVIDFVGLTELYYAGSHGMDIKGPAKPRHTKAKAKSVLFQPAREFLPMIDGVYKSLLERTKSTAGAKVENNKFCVSVHFRCVDEKSWGALIEQVRSVLKEYPKLRLTQGRKVLEIRPTIKWDKGKALEFLLESLGFADCKDVMPVYIGDDRTDEDAFKVLRDRGQGLGILVSKFPKETNATYSLQEPTEVKDFLVRLVEWKRPTMKALSKV